MKTTMSDTTHKAQVTASQVKDQAKELFDETRALVAEQAPIQRDRLVETVKGITDEIASSDLAATVVDKTRDLASHRPGQKKQGLFRKLGSSVRHHPFRWLLGTAAVGAGTSAVVRQRRHGPVTTTNAPAYGESTPGYRTQDAPVTAPEGSLTPGR